MEPIILASSSPRRQEILKSLNIPFRVITSDIDETYPKDMNISEVPEFLASRKVNAVVRTFNPDQNIPWILGADTLVIHGKNKALGKPENPEQAENYLKLLSGKTHRVISGIALFNGTLNYLSTRTSITKVKFKDLTEDEIKWYISTGEWHGAAGGYRIQGMASMFIEKIDGSYSGVVGLPIFDIYEILKEQGYTILQ
jgi:septum formation protein